MSCISLRSYGTARVVPSRLGSAGLRGGRRRGGSENGTLASLFHGRPAAGHRASRSGDSLAASCQRLAWVTALDLVDLEPVRVRSSSVLGVDRTVGSPVVLTKPPARSRALLRSSRPKTTRRSRNPAGHHRRRAWSLPFGVGAASILQGASRTEPCRGRPHPVIRRQPPLPDSASRERFRRARRTMRGFGSTCARHRQGHLARSADAARRLSRPEGLPSRCSQRRKPGRSAGCGLSDRTERL